VSGRTRIALAAAGAVAIFVLVAAGWWWLDRREAAEEAAREGAAMLPLPVDLYFPSQGTTLGRERRELRVTEDPEDRLLALARALLEGPEDPSLFRPLPAGVEARAVYLDPAGVAYLDLVAEDAAEPPAGGTTEEMLRVYSLVNTLVLNVPQARSAVLLWNGEQRTTFSGHLDTSRPLVPDAALVERPRAPR
jgi:hypothetical protein